MDEIDRIMEYAQKKQRRIEKVFKMKKLELGDKFYTADGYLNHIINIFPYDCQFLVAYKFWSRYKNRWCFGIDKMSNLLFLISILNDLSKEDRVKYFKLNEIEYLI